MYLPMYHLSKYFITNLCSHHLFLLLVSHIIQSTIAKGSRASYLQSDHGRGPEFESRQGWCNVKTSRGHSLIDIRSVRLTWNIQTNWTCKNYYNHHCSQPLRLRKQPKTSTESDRDPTINIHMKTCSTKLLIF